MNVIRAILDSGWTVAGGTLVWILFVVGLLAAARRPPAPVRERARLWDDRR